MSSGRSISKSRRNRKTLPVEAFRAAIDSLAHDGRGVTHVIGKATFIEGALPGEEVMFTYVMQRRRYDEGLVTEVITPSPERVAPQCRHFGLCGGCSLQHLRADAQIHMKEQILLDNLRHIGHLEPDEILQPLAGTHRGYRRRAPHGAQLGQNKHALQEANSQKRSANLAENGQSEGLHAKGGMD